MKKFIFTLVLCCTSCVYAQNETNHWYFGYNAGLDFSTLPPTPLPGSSLSTEEGSASISDPVTGALLFYTNGVEVYDATHNTMPNGTGLLGNQSCTQSCIIVPMPDSSHLYYIFTADAMENAGIYGFRYSVVDMDLNSGLGDVTTKNVLLYSPNSEQLCAVKHANCRDWWVMSKMLNNDAYYAYLVTPTGVSGPVISNLGIPCSGFSAGQAKFSPDGTRYASAIANGTGIQLCDFDNTTGVLSNNIVLMDTDISLENTFAISFSSDNTKLYASRGGMMTDIYQYDLTSGIAATIIASGTSIGLIPGFGTMQMGKDHKIYITTSPAYPNISVINNPNVLGVGCNLTTESVPIAGTAVIGICNFPDSYFNETSPCPVTPAANISAINVSCNNANDGVAIVQVFGNNGPYTVLWTPGGFTTDTVMGLGPGTYTVTVTDSLGYVFSATVNMINPPVLSVEIAGPDTICQQNIILTAVASGGTGSYLYNWSVGPDDSLDQISFTPTSSVDVYVEVEDGSHCTAGDTLHIHVIPIEQVQAGNDTCICKGQSVVLTATGTPGFTWSTGDTTASVTVSPLINTIYFVIYDTAGCTTIDTVNICVYDRPGVSISGTDSVCMGTLVNLMSMVSGGTGPMVYEWSVLMSNTPNLTFTPLTSTLVQLVVEDNNGCSDTAVHPITVFSLGTVSANNDTCICAGEQAQLTATGVPHYYWSNGQTDSSITVSPLTSTQYIVSYLNGICDTHDTVNVCVYPLPVIWASGDTNVTYGASIPLEVTGMGNVYWSPSTGLECITCNNTMAAPGVSTLYTITVTDTNGCTATENIFVQVDFVFNIPNIITPNGDGMNDVFNINGLPPQSALHIFNRWGNPMFFTGNYQNDWKCDADGVYYFVLQTPDGKTFTGFVQVTGR